MNLGERKIGIRRRGLGVGDWGFEVTSSKFLLSIECPDVFDSGLGGLFDKGDLVEIKIGVGTA